MKDVAFKLDGYQFTKVSFDLDIPNQAELIIAFNPKGTFHPKGNLYELNFDTIVTCKETSKDIISISCVATFTLKDCTSIDDIPEFFYPNSLAIIFPYVRAFVSTISLQANVKPILLPTINLMGLTETLRTQTQVVDSNK